MPSGRSVTARVVHTSGACQRTYGGCGTGRGNGNAVRPPTVCTNRTAPSSCAGSGRSTGSGAARKVAPILPTRTVVAPITRPLPGSRPASTTRPSSTSAQTESRLANRNLSWRHSSCSSSGPLNVSGNGLSQCESRRSIPVFSAPLSESDGIQDIDVTVAVWRMINLRGRGFRGNESSDG